MKKHLWLLALAAGIIPFWSCSKSDSTVTMAKVHDPSIPIQVQTFSPDSGRVRTKFVIQGSNFGSDTSKIRVLFAGRKKATVIGANGNMIYCLVPTQPDGYNDVTVIVDKDTIVVPDKQFHYTVAKNVSTITGKYGVAALLDGTLVTATFTRVGGIGVLDGDNLIAFSSWDNAVRLVSLTGNQVVTLSTNIGAGKPAVTRDKLTAFAIARVSPHAVYRFDKNNLWAPKKVTSQISGFTGDIWAVALDSEEKWLYFRDATGKLGRLEIANPANIQTLNTACGKVAGTLSYIAYNPVDDHFYLSVQNAYGIYRISKDGLTVEAYAGLSPSPGGLDGSRLTDATFSNPTGMTFDADGNLYVTDSGGFTIRTISAADGSVTTVAGTYKSTTADADGDPAFAVFSYPYDIATDGEGNYYIAESWGYCIRKYAIE